MEDVDLEAQLVAHPHQHLHLVRAVAVDVHDALALQDLRQRLQAEVSAGRQGRRRARRLLLLVIAPPVAVGARLQEGGADHVLHPHAAGRVTPLHAGSGIRSARFRVAAERELEAGRCAFEQHLVRGRPHRHFTTALWPPIGFTLPWRMFEVVLPPRAPDRHRCRWGR
jgi:hypothetical protein